MTFLRSKILKSIGLNLGILIVLFWVFIPIFWLFLVSLKPETQVLSRDAGLFFTPTFDAYKWILSERGWPRFWWNSIVVATISTSIAMIIGVLATYGITRFRFKNRHVTLFMILSVRFTPPIVVLIPIFFMMKELNMTDSIWGLSFIHAVFALPFVVWILIGFFIAIPSELIDAALVDGLTEFGALVRIIVPVIRPGLVAAALFSVLLSWNEFPVALILTGETAKTIPVAATTLIAERTIHWDRIAATGMIAIVPTVIFAVFIQRHLIRGLSAGIVK